MKKTLLVAAFALAGSIAFAQKPSAGDKTVETSILFQTGTAPVSFFTPNLRGRYFLSDDLALRVSFLFESNKETFNFTEKPDGTGGKGFTTNKTSSFTFAPGIEKHFEGTSKLSPYIGGVLGLTLDGASSEWDNTLDGGNTFTNGTKFKVDGATVDYVDGPDPINLVALAGPSIGVSLVLGADYYVTDALYIGAEVLWGWQTSSSKEVTIESTTGAGTNKSVLPKSSQSGFGIATSGLRLGWKF
jgi:hypothetical protein